MNSQTVASQHPCNTQAGVTKHERPNQTSFSTFHSISGPSLPSPCTRGVGGMKLICVLETPGQTSDAASGSSQALSLILERDYLATKVLEKHLQSRGFLFSPDVCGFHRCIFLLSSPEEEVIRSMTRLWDHKICAFIRKSLSQNTPHALATRSPSGETDPRDGD